MARIVKTGAMVVVDHPQQVEWYQEAAIAAGRKIDVLVDLDVGDHRTGARSPEDAAEIAEAVDQAAHLELRGIQAYSVLGSHAGGLVERKRVSREPFQVASRALGIMLRCGLSTEIVTGGRQGPGRSTRRCQISPSYRLDPTCSWTWRIAARSSISRMRSR